MSQQSSIPGAPFFFNPVVQVVINLIAAVFCALIIIGSVGQSRWAPAVLFALLEVWFVYAIPTAKFRHARADKMRDIIDSRGLSQRASGEPRRWSHAVEVYRDAKAANPTPAYFWVARVFAVLVASGLFAIGAELR